MATPDVISYLNSRDASPFVSKLNLELQKSRQNKAKASQWLGLINGMTQKGVRGLEIEESGIKDWLASLDPGETLSLDRMLSELQRRQVTVKEVMLGSPKYASYRHVGGDYHEYLYIANSERNNIEDEIDRIDYELEQLSFDLDRLAEDPAQAARLASERMTLMSRKATSLDFPYHHFSDRVTGKLGRNLLFHVRASTYPDFYLVHEIQSDWAQRGRRQGASDRTAFDTGAIPKGPFVTDTEAWAGLALRRHMQIAAHNPSIQRFLWIRGFMRNGWSGTEGGSHDNDGLDDFYVKIVPKLADKALKGSGGKCRFFDVTLTASSGATKTYQVPGFEMTPEVRAHLLRDAMPLYSHAQVGREIRRTDDPQVTQALALATEMLGSARHIRMFTHVYDIHTTRQVAGKFVNRMVHLALNAQDIVEASAHECFHFGHALLMTTREREIVASSFQPGSRLNFEITSALVLRGDMEAAAQCTNPEEAAAHAFALWTKGEFSVKEPEVKGLFSDLVTVFRDCVRWVRRHVLDEQLQTPEEVFEALRHGRLAEREKERQRVRGAILQP
jgi:predicted  nucleic acid-binding Zn-ribbon protein